MSLDVQQLCYNALRNQNSLLILTDYLLENNLIHPPTNYIDNKKTLECSIFFSVYLWIKTSYTKEQVLEVPAKDLQIGDIFPRLFESNKYSIITSIESNYFNQIEVNFDDGSQLRLKDNTQYTIIRPQNIILHSNKIGSKMNKRLALAQKFIKKAQNSEPDDYFDPNKTYQTPSNEFINDFTLKKPNEQYPVGYVSPEMTEELDELVKDSLNLVLLMERSFVEFQKNCVKSNNTMGNQFASNALIDLEDIEDALTNPNFLVFDLNVEHGLIEAAHHNANMIASVLKLTLENGNRAKEFKHLDPNVYKWTKELLENLEKIADISSSQSDLMENVFNIEPKRMLEQDERDVDLINPEEIHPDFNNSLASLINEFVGKIKKQAILELESDSPDPWLAGFENGKYDCNMNQWGDPRSSWHAWYEYKNKENPSRLAKKDPKLVTELKNNYKAYKAGYEKALILNNGIGMTSHPDDHEVWEQPHHPWGYNRSKIKEPYATESRKIDEIWQSNKSYIMPNSISIHKIAHKFYKNCLGLNLNELCYQAIRNKESFDVLTDYLLENNLITVLDENDSKSIFRNVYQWIKDNYENETFENVIINEVKAGDIIVRFDKGCFNEVFNVIELQGVSQVEDIYLLEFTNGTKDTKWIKSCVLCTIIKHK